MRDHGLGSRPDGRLDVRTYNFCSILLFETVYGTTLHTQDINTLMACQIFTIGDKTRTFGLTVYEKGRDLSVTHLQLVYLSKKRVRSIIYVYNYLFLERPTVSPMLFSKVKRVSEVVNIVQRRHGP